MTRFKTTGRRAQTRGRLTGTTIGLLLLAAVVAMLPAAAGGARNASASASASKGLWQAVGASNVTRSAKAKTADVRPSRFSGYSLDRKGMASLLASAPADGTLTLSLPTPRGGFERFALERSQIMAPALAKKHPDISTFRGRGIDDPTATIHADLTPLGFHASVRSTRGAWYIDPAFHLDQSVYVSYYGRDLPKEPTGSFVERDASAAELSVDKGFYHAGDTVTVRGSGFPENADVTLGITDLEGDAASRTVAASADASGSFEASFVADPDGKLGDRIVTASSGDASASAAYQVVRDDDPTSDPPTGDVLRLYRLALITDPGYAAYHGGPAFVTPAKVTLMNRVSQVYEDDLSITMQLIAQTDQLNLDTWALATAPNGPCGAAACYTQAQVTGCSNLARNRVVAGQIVGAENYDIGHLALGQPGGGVANLGVVGRAQKAQGCTGIPTPTGDFYAIDYVAHEMGHQFSGNHPFNGNQLNCSGGNRSGATSVEPGSGSSIMAYAGICLTDDLSPHSDPYFSQRSLQEISTYTSSNQAAINEVQSVALRHFGGGNEVQVATFGPGFQPTNAIQPLTVAIGAAPNGTTQLGGLSEDGNLVTVSTGAAGATHTLQPGDSITISGAGDPGYNGTFTVNSVLTSRAFTYLNPVSGLPRTGGGTITLNAPGLSESGTTVTVRTTLAHNRSVGDQVTISGAGNAGYNQAAQVTITSVPTPRSFTFENAVAGLPNAGGGTVTYTSPFRLRIGGNDSVLLGSGGLQYSNANLTTAINGIAGFAGTGTVTGAASTGFTVTYTGASAGLDVPNVEIVNLVCGGCFANVEETNHGGALDSFTLNYDGNVSAPIVNGTNYTAAGIQAALLPLLPAGATATVAGFGGGTFNNTGFQVTYGGTLGLQNVPVRLALQDFTPGASAFVNELDKGGAVDNKGGVITPTGNAIPAVTAPVQYQIPLRTPFALTGSATDADGDPLLYSWEQNDRGGTAGTALMNNVKTNGPLFAMFPKSATMTEEDTLEYNSPGENHLTDSPTRVFPDLQQVLDNNTNADTGACPQGPIAPPVAIPVKECFAEFLPTSDYVGFTGVNASPLSLHFRFTARDLRGGVNAADTTLLLTPATGPFRVTSPNTAVTYEATSTQTVTWDVAGTDLPPISTANVKISLSLDGGHTYPYVLAASTPNDGSEAVTLPYDGSAHARIKVEAVDNVYFDVSNADFTIHATPTVTNDAPAGGATVEYSDPMTPVTVSATDPDSDGSDLTATASGLPAGATLASASVSPDGTDPGTHTWTVGGTITAAPGTYPVTVTVTDEAGASASTSFDVVVLAEDDIEIGYEGDELTFVPAKKHSEKVLLRATIQETDSSKGDVRNATITFSEDGDTLCGPLPVSLQNGNTANGVASCTVVLDLGLHDIDITVGGYYTGEEDQVVEVAEPDDAMITAAGETVLSSSAGIYKGTSGSRMGFGISVKYKDGKGGGWNRHSWHKRESLSGHADIVFKSGGKTYRVKSDDFESLGVDFEKPSGGSCNGPTGSKCYGFADLRMNAKLLDVSKKKRSSTVASNLSLRITLTDRGSSHGSNDSIGVTLWQGSKLLFSSRWNGTETVEQALKSGKVHVH